MLVEHSFAELGRVISGNPAKQAAVPKAGGQHPLHRGPDRTQRWGNAEVPLRTDGRTGPSPARFLSNDTELGRLPKMTLICKPGCQARSHYRLHLQAGLPGRLLHGRKAEQK